MKKVICFGEILLRMSPALDRKWIESASMPIYVGGAELNVAQALAKWDVPVRYITAMPDHYLSREITETLRLKNIDTGAIHLSGKRIGAYYLPQGADLKNAGVIYDRAHSSFAELQPGMIDWDKVLTDYDWFHFSAISPALTDTTALVCVEAVKAARRKGLTISIDLNYRAKLWQYGKSPIDIMPTLVEYCDVIMGNIWAVESLVGIPSPIAKSDGLTKEELVEAARTSMEAVRFRFSGANTIAYTFRLEKEYWAILQRDNAHVVSDSLPIGEVVDKVGSGDCFMAGLIYGSIQQHQPSSIVAYAASAAVGKLGEIGDATQQTTEKVKSRIAWNGNNK